ncbi:MAG: hypothetical protein ISS36_04410 [Candidatus Aenigmarchaeota archaeon]|nr:hypothetical protein [Candidatus Aenigmarchaeota archaeon]
MGILEEVLKNKEEIVIALLSALEGKETGAKVNLNGVKFKIGNSEVNMEGKLEISFTPIKKKE